jgi:hypothetical protein
MVPGVIDVELACAGLPEKINFRKKYIFFLER